LGEENTTTAAEVFIVVKTRKSGTAAGCREIRPAMRKIWTEFWLTRVCLVPLCSGSAPKDLAN